MNNVKEMSNTDVGLNLDYAGILFITQTHIYTYSIPKQHPNLNKVSYIATDYFILTSEFTGKFGLAFWIDVSINVDAVV